MDEELKPEVVSEVNTQTLASDEKKEEQALDSLPRLEDLLKSEKTVKPAQKLEGVTEVEKTTFFEQVPFTKKEDKRAPLFKKRIKIVSSVLVSTITLLLAFVGVSTFTLIKHQKEVNANTETINTVLKPELEKLQNSVGVGNSSGEFEITLNPPRDYDDDQKELTILDKLTIIFRSIFS